MKKILGIEEYIPGILKIRIEATKRRKIWVKILRGAVFDSCDPTVCPLYRQCIKMKSPLKKYHNFSDFCNHLFSNYPNLADLLRVNFGVKHINQVVPIKRIGR